MTRAERIEVAEKAPALAEALRSVVASYELALKDTRMVLPTPLMCALEQARRVL